MEAGECSTVGIFSDSKIAGVELIHHGVRTATNGDVRLSPTPEQWDPAPTVKSRTVQRTSESPSMLKAGLSLHC